MPGLVRILVELVELSCTQTRAQAKNIVSNNKVVGGIEVKVKKTTEML